MKIKTKLLALPAVALIAGASMLPASAQCCGDYGWSGYGFGNYPDYGYYTTSYPAVVGSTYVNPYYGGYGYGFNDYGYYGGGLGYGLGSALYGAGAGALGGLAAGAIFSPRHIGRTTAIGAGIGAGLGLLNGLWGGGGYWY